LRDNAEVPSVRVELVRWVADEPLPGLVEARLVDVEGRAWSFIDKEPIFSADAIGPRDVFPRSGVLNCRVIDDAAPSRGVVGIETTETDSVENRSEFVVKASEIIW
jgi:hypothetical protein